MTTKRLYRSNNRILGGVCAGIAEYLDIDPIVVRIIAAVLLVAAAAAPVIVYLVLWAVVPARPDDYTSYVDVTPESVRSANVAGSQGAMPDTSNGGFAASSTWEFVPPQPPPAPAPDPAKSAAPSKRTGTRVVITCGIVLVCIGLAAIAGRFLGITDWWEFWPVLVIALGINLIVCSGTQDGVSAAKVFDGVLIAVIGAVLLVCSLSLVPWSVWSAIIALWPLYLIALGIAIAAFAKRSDKLRAAAAVLVVVAIALGVCNFQLNTGLFTSSVTVKHLNGVELSSGDAASIAIAHEQGAIELNAGGTSFSLAGHDGEEATLSGSSGGVNGSMLDYDTSNGGLTINAGGIGLTGDYACLVPSRVTWNSVSINGGASNLDVDLTQLSVGDLYVAAGASSVSVALGQPLDAGSNVEVEAGMSRVRIIVPAGVEAIVYSDGLDAVYLGNSFTRRNVDETVYETPGYGKAVYRGTPVWTLYVTGGMGTLELEHPIPTTVL